MAFSSGGPLEKQKQCCLRQLRWPIWSLSFCFSIFPFFVWRQKTGDSITEILCKMSKAQRSSESISLTTRWFRKTWVTWCFCSYHYRQRGAVLVKRISAPCPLNPTVPTVCWCCICLLCCVNFTFSSTGAWFSLLAQIVWIFPATSHVSACVLGGALKHGPFAVFNQWLLWLCKQPCSLPTTGSERC